MQPLLNGTEKGRWQTTLVEDLSYIKKHLRYRPTVKTFLPAVFWGGFLLLLVILVAISIYIKQAEGIYISLLSLIMAAIIFIMFAANIIRYINSLKFTSISTGYHLAENQLLIEQFLKTNHFALSRHPVATEVFQIMSRNLGTGKEQREVLLLIADDNRILINSHFTDGGWGFLPVQRHHRQIARMLEDFINTQASNTGAMHQIF